MLKCYEKLKSLASYIKGDVNDPDGFVDPSGCSHRSAIDLVQNGILGFCCCGDPLTNLQFVRDGLAHLANLPEMSTDQAVWHERFEKLKAEGLILLGNEASRNFFFYWLDKEELTEHGGCIPGWLTDRGESLLSLLNEVLAEEKK